MKLQELVRGIHRTKLLYLDDSYMRTLESKIIRLKSEKKKNVYLIFEKTIFHPKSGGQPSDKGFINSRVFRVFAKKAMIVDGVIIHWGKMVEGEPEETTAIMEIDWPSRYLYMRRHTAGHLLDHCLNIITGTAVETFESWLGDPCYVGYKGYVLSMDMVMAAINLGNEMIKKGASVNAKIVPYNELIEFVPNAPNIYRLPLLKKYRIVTINGCNPIPCAGTHIKNINEVGCITLNNIENTNSKFKIYYDVQ